MRKRAGGRQDVVDEAHALEEFGPVHLGDEAHAGDDVAHRHAAGHLPLLLLAHHGVRSLPTGGEAFVEPGQGRRNAGILVAQPLHQLDEERVGQIRPVEAGQHRGRWLRRAAASAQQAVGQIVGVEPAGTAGDHAVRKPPEVLDQHDAQGDGHRPQLADGERPDLLIGADVAPQLLGVEPAVGVRNKGPGHREDLWQTREGTRRELGQLSIISSRQIGADVADLLFDHMEIVDQPLGGRRYRRARLHRRGDVMIGLNQHSFILRQALGEDVSSTRLRQQDLRGGQAATMFFEALDAEQLLADWPLVPRRGRSAGEQSAQSACQWVGSRPLHEGLAGPWDRPHASIRRLWAGMGHLMTGADGGFSAGRSVCSRPSGRAP